MFSTLYLRGIYTNNNNNYARWIKKKNQSRQKVLTHIPYNTLTEILKVINRLLLTSKCWIYFKKKMIIYFILKPTMLEVMKMFCIHSSGKRQYRSLLNHLFKTIFNLPGTAIIQCNGNNSILISTLMRLVHNVFTNYWNKFECLFTN